MAKKSLRTYKPVMGIIHNGEPLTDIAEVLAILDKKRGTEIVSWPGGKVLFYFDPRTGDVVYPHDIDYAYLINDEPTTALELIKFAKKRGFRGNDTRGAATFLRSKRMRIEKNPRPTKKFTGLKSR